MAVGWQEVASEVALWLCSSRWPMWPVNMALLWQYVTNVTIYLALLWQYVTNAMWQYTWPPFDKKGPIRLTKKCGQFIHFPCTVTNMTLCAITGHWSSCGKTWQMLPNCGKTLHCQNDQLLTSDVTNLTNLWLTCYDRHDQPCINKYFLGVGRPSYSTYCQQI